MKLNHVVVVTVLVLVGLIGYALGNPGNGTRNEAPGAGLVAGNSSPLRESVKMFVLEKKPDQPFFAFPVWTDLAEKLDWTVLWNRIDRTLSMQSAGRHVRLTYGVPIVEKNGRFEPHFRVLEMAADGTPLINLSLFESIFGNAPIAVVGSAGDAKHPLAASVDVVATQAAAPAWPPPQQPPRDHQALIDHLAFLQHPLRGADVDLADTHVVGAPRSYRSGTHEGFDFYSVRIGVPLTQQTLVLSMARGTVIRADHDWSTPSPATYRDWIARSEAAGRTPAWILDLLRGRQVWVAHDNGVVARYAHLSSVRPDLHVGHLVEAGETLGTVGSSGTSGERDGTGLHLHLDISIYGHLLWIDYTPGEQRELLAAIFEPGRR